MNIKMQPILTVSKLIGHKSWVQSVAISPDDKLIMTGSHDGTIRLWEAETGKHLQTYLSRGRVKAMVKEVRFTPDGKYGLACSWGETRMRVSHCAWLFEIETGMTVRQFGSMTAVLDLDLSSDGKHVATSGDNQVVIWDIDTGEEIKSFEKYYNANVRFTTDNRYVVIANGGQVYIRSISDGLLHTHFNVDEHTTSGMAVSPDGMYLATAWTGVQITKIDDIDNPTNWFSVKKPICIRCVTFTHDSMFFLTGEQYHPYLRVWSMEDKKTVLQLQEHEDMILSVAVASNGKFFVTGSADYTARIWRINE